MVPEWNIFLHFTRSFLRFADRYRHAKVPSKISTNVPYLVLFSWVYLLLLRSNAEGNYSFESRSVPIFAEQHRTVGATEPERVRHDCIKSGVFDQGRSDFACVYGRIQRFDVDARDDVITL